MWFVAPVLDSAHLLSKTDTHKNYSTMWYKSRKGAMYYGTQDSLFMLPISLVHVTTDIWIGNRDLEMNWWMMQSKKLKI